MNTSSRIGKGGLDAEGACGDEAETRVVRRMADQHDERLAARARPR
jgi:hypothetical protein